MGGDEGPIAGWIQVEERWPGTETEATKGAGGSAVKAISDWDIRLPASFPSLHLDDSDSQSG